MKAIEACNYNFRLNTCPNKSWTNPKKNTISLTLCYDHSPRPVVIYHLDVSKMDVAVEDAVAARRGLAVVEGQRDDVLEEGGLLEGLHGGVEVALVREVDTLEDGPLGVEQVALVALAGEAVGGQVAVGAGARTAPAAQVETELLAAAVAPGTRVGSCCRGGKKRKRKESRSNIASKEHGKHT